MVSLMDNYNYDAMTKKELIQHAKAYAESIHTMATTIMRLEDRLRKQEQLREHLHGAKI